ncbi:MAG: hypothetical protein ACREO5_00075 [Candidatus Binatia bacterium]
MADWVSKESSRSDLPLFTGGGFHVDAVYDRLACGNLKREAREVQRTLATNADLTALHYLLLCVFDKYADHIVSVAEFAELIRLGEVLVSRDKQGAIDGAVVFRTLGGSCNFNFLYHSGSFEALTHLLNGFYKLLAEKDIHSIFGWVRRTRPLVAKLHEWYGWKKDGLVDYIYMR